MEKILQIHPASINNLSWTRADAVRGFYGLESVRNFGGKNTKYIYVKPQFNTQSLHLCQTNNSSLLLSTFVSDSIISDRFRNQIGWIPQGHLLLSLLELRAGKITSLAPIELSNVGSCVFLSAFEEAELPRLKEEKPGLTHNQYKDMIWKLWKKSPDNPLNQVAAE
ncbi:uncharacterized protein LOC126795737 [Argentina anserina]|uniref:uncharacterized protein LOC126795737 n=1 Tax=Argentina anserina TaxID=57926 RepID=UPI0021765A86|nr:uncharacterized protein LOC126795737 [Potentilla anserina]